MTDTFPAFDTGPVPIPGPHAEPPEPFRGIYGMPTFVRIPTADLAASVDFWIRGLGFFEIFSIPGQITHLRRWTFQDVLLVTGDRAVEAPALNVYFSCVLSQVDETAAACEELLPGSTTGPQHMPWNTVELEIVTPENARVTMTAAKPYDASSTEAENLREMGIEAPEG
ncbi:hypothetical protein GCM10023169_17180 [Georgenia halophila]|uniref:VOC family protein n=1 Tax=Georgenia halophila TaxID=620889 RepID=A0ABP8L5E8_9MICO